jgi:MFS family permease
MMPAQAGFPAAILPLVASDSASYRRLFRAPGFRRVAAGMVLSRTGDGTWQLVLVLFVLARFHSPALAGVAAFCGIAPSKPVAPIAGALLDRYGRVRLVVGDYSIAAFGLGSIVVLDVTGALNPVLLCVILVGLGITAPLSETGLRSLFPLLVPRQLWDRANAVDSGTFVIAGLVGPAAGGLLVAVAGPDAAVLAVAALFASAAIVTLGLKDPARPERVEGEGLLTAAWAGLRYVLANPTLRGLGIVISLLNVGGGIIFVGIPVVVQDHLGQTPTVTGIVLAGFGLAGLVSSVIVGRLGSEGRERALLAAGNTIIAVGIALCAAGGPIWLLIVGLVIAGAGNGPCDIALFALRQRRTDPRMFGRAMAVSMAVNSIGLPVGTLLAGTLLAAGHITAVFLLGAGLTLLGVALIPVLIPREAPR